MTLPKVLPPIPETIKEKFWAKVSKNVDTDCWEWTGNISRSGYGRLMHKYLSRFAHRISFEIANGPIPEGLVIDHLCRNTKCVNPNHLRACTSRENVMAPHSQGFGVRYASLKCCPKCGGEYVLRINQKRRKCIPCSNKAQNDYWSRHKEKRKEHARNAYIKRKLKETT